MLPVAEHSACSKVNGRLVAVDEKSMVCAGGQGKGACQVNKECYIFPKSQQLTYFGALPRLNCSNRISSKPWGLQYRKTGREFSSGILKKTKA